MHQVETEEKVIHESLKNSMYQLVFFVIIAKLFI